MGNSQSLVGQIPKLQDKKWIEADEDQTTNFFNNVNPFRKRLLMNISTHQLIEQYEINFVAEEEFDNYIKEIHYRLQNSPENISINQTASLSRINNQAQSQQQKMQKRFIYPIRYFTNKSKQEMCTTVYTGYLYIQKVDLRLKQINDIPFEDQLYIYKATLQGFKILYQKVGFFDIKQEMIFINKKGQIRVWMNANLSKNYPNFQKKQQSLGYPYNNFNRSSKNLMSHPKNQVSIYGSQSQMIKDLLKLIENNSDSLHNAQGSNQFFSDYLDQKNILERMSFDYALEQFNNYIGENHFRFRPYMASIIELFNSQDNSNSHNQLAKKNYTQKEFDTGIQQSQVNEVMVNQVQSNFSNHNRSNQNNQFHIPQSKSQRPMNQYRKTNGIQNFSNFSSQMHGQLQAVAYEKRNYRQSNQLNKYANFVQKDQLKDSRYSYQNNNTDPNNSNNNDSSQYLKLRESSRSNNLLDRNTKLDNTPFNHATLNRNNHQQIVRNIIRQNNLSHRFAQQTLTPANNHQIQPAYYQIQQNHPQDHQKSIRISRSPNPILLNVKDQHEHTPSFAKYPPMPPRSNLICINNRPVHILKNYPVAQLNSARGDKHVIIQQIQRPQYQKKGGSFIERPFQQGEGGYKLGFRKTATMESQGMISQQGSSLKINSIPKLQKLQKQSNISKSNIKYYSNNTTYELDDQIARDLQKMLGLTVN